ncbi:hypothetical protein [Luteolibacter sp. Populi]|uniref:hypothetical protein n=1 Tax=Luteolibacter sp. Populi TaxID=3230487 RepID=UPI003466C734
MRRDSRSPGERPASTTPAALPGASGSWREVKFTLAAGLTVFLVICGLVVAGFAIWAMVAKKEQAAGTGAAMTTGTGPAVTEIPTPPPSTLVEQVNSMLKARTPEELAPLIRKSEQEPAAIIAKLAKLGEVDGKVQRVRYLHPIDSRSLRLEAVLVEFVGKRNRLALISPDAEGRWQIDFDGFDRHVSTPWPDLLSGKATESKVRVTVAGDVYFNGAYRDEAKWACFAMQSPDSEESMFCYVPRGGEQQAAMNAVVAAKGEAEGKRAGRTLLRRMILGIRHNEGSDPRQFEVVRVYSDEWAEGAKALDEIIREQGATE